MLDFRLTTPSPYDDFLASTQHPFPLVAATVSAALLPAAHLMRSIAGGYDNESIAVTVIAATFYLWVRSLRSNRCAPPPRPPGPATPLDTHRAKQRPGDPDQGDGSVFCPSHHHIITSPPIWPPTPSNALSCLTRPSPLSSAGEAAFFSEPSPHGLFPHPFVCRSPPPVSNSRPWGPPLRVTGCVWDQGGGQQMAGGGHPPSTAPPRVHSRWEQTTPLGIITTSRAVVCHPHPPPREEGRHSVSFERSLFLLLYIIIMYINITYINI